MDPGDCHFVDTSQSPFVRPLIMNFFASPKSGYGFNLIRAFSICIMNDLTFGIGLWMTREGSLVPSTQRIG